MAASLPRRPHSVVHADNTNPSFFGIFKKMILMLCHGVDMLYILPRNRSNRVLFLRVLSRKYRPLSSLFGNPLLPSHPTFPRFPTRSWVSSHEAWRGCVPFHQGLSAAAAAGRGRGCPHRERHGGRAEPKYALNNYPEGKSSAFPFTISNSSRNVKEKISLSPRVDSGSLFLFFFFSPSLSLFHSGGVTLFSWVASQTPDLPGKWITRGCVAEDTVNKPPDCLFASAQAICAGHPQSPVPIGRT